LFISSNAYTSDGQYKEPQQQPQLQWGQQRREQPKCRPGFTPSIYHGQYAGCSTSSAATATSDRLGYFQHTKPPTLFHAVELMDADDWLKSIEKKLQVVQCNNREKVLLASHQLSSPAADWWDAYVEAHEGPESINWSEFRAVFPAHHVP
jgi:hypothetical protein